MCCKSVCSNIYYYRYKPHAFLAHVCVGVGVGVYFSHTACAPLVRMRSKVYISGEEMTKYCMDLIRDQWISPYINTQNWEYFDLSCVGRVSSSHLLFLLVLCTATRTSCVLFLSVHCLMVNVD